jgi:hypothetical protein
MSRIDEYNGVYVAFAEVDGAEIRRDFRSETAAKAWLAEVEPKKVVKKAAPKKKAVKKEVVVEEVAEEVEEVKE